MWRLLAVLPLGAIALLSSRRLYFNWGFGAGLVLLLFAAVTVAVEPLSAKLAGFRIYPEDVIFAALFGIAALRLTFGGEMRARHLPWLLFAVATAGSFVIGSQLYGIKPAGVEYRSIFYVLAGCLYCGSFRIHSDGLKRLVVMWLWTAGLLMALACFRWTAEFLQLDIREQWAGVGGINAMRVLNASQTLFLAQAFLVTLYLYGHVASRLVLGCFSAALLLAVILLQHRSAWVALAVSCLVVAWREQAWRKFIAAGLLTVLLCGPAYLLVTNYAPSVGQSVRSSAEEPFDASHSTIAWRAELWQQYLVEFVALTGVQTWLGTGFGNPAIYTVDGTGVSNAAHNHFIHTLNRAGILGLAALLVCYGMMLFQLRGAKGSWDYLGLFAAITCGHLVFYMVYAPSFEQSLISGAVVGMIAKSEGGLGHES
jgi:O-antigen ligase